MLEPDRVILVSFAPITDADRASGVRADAVIESIDGESVAAVQQRVDFNLRIGNRRLVGEVRYATTSRRSTADYEVDLTSGSTGSAGTQRIRIRLTSATGWIVESSCSGEPAERAASPGPCEGFTKVLVADEPITAARALQNPHVPLSVPPGFYIREVVVGLAGETSRSLGNSFALIYRAAVWSGDLETYIQAYVDEGTEVLSRQMYPMRRRADRTTRDFEYSISGAPMMQRYVRATLDHGVVWSLACETLDGQLTKAPRRFCMRTLDGFCVGGACGPP